GYAYTAKAFDADGNPLAFTLAGAPAGMTIDPATGSITWTPTVAQIGINAVSVAASDGQGATATQDFNILVAPEAANHAPMIISTPPTSFTFAAGTYTYAVHALDAENDSLTYSLTSAPAGMTIDPATGLITWTPDVSQ